MNVRNKAAWCISAAMILAAAPMAGWAAQPDAAKPQPAAAAGAGESAYIRVRDDEATGRTRLELSARSFQKADGTGPVVTLASAIHIADKSFYDAVQAWLDKQDLVLFEGVKPPGSDALGDNATPEQRAKQTAARLKVIAQAVERYCDKHGEFPQSLAELRGKDKRFSAVLESLSKDGWGREFMYSLAPAAAEKAASFVLSSLGADNKPGGEGPAADQTATGTQKPGVLGVAKAGGGKSKGVQQQLADALGLTFQLEAMDSSKPNWRSSDMSVDELQDRIEKAGGDASALLSMLDGNSLGAKLMGLLLNFIGSSKPMSTMAKVMMVEAMGMAEQMMGNGMAAGPMAGLGPAMKVIVHDRNEVVMNDLRAVIEKEPGVRTVAAFYGAGHMPDLEKQLVESLGMKFTEETWFTAIEVDPKEGGMSPAQVKSMRAMIRSQMDSMSRAAKKPATKEPAK